MAIVAPSGTIAAAEERLKRLEAHRVAVDALVAEAERLRHSQELRDGMAKLTAFQEKHGTQRRLEEARAVHCVKPRRLTRDDAFHVARHCRPVKPLQQAPLTCFRIRQGLQPL